MKREIDGRVYDTTLAMLIASHEKASTHVHRAISLYRSVDGDFFVVEERDAHGVDSVVLTPLSAEMAREWLDEHGKTDMALAQFGNREVTITLSLDQALSNQIAEAAKARGTSKRDWIIDVLKSALPAAAHSTPDAETA